MSAANTTLHVRSLRVIGDVIWFSDQALNMTCNVFLPGYQEMSHVSICFQSQFKLKLPPWVEGVSDFYSGVSLALVLILVDSQHAADKTFVFFLIWLFSGLGVVVGHLLAVAESITTQTLVWVHRTCLLPVSKSKAVKDLHSEESLCYHSPMFPHF